MLVPALEEHFHEIREFENNQENGYHDYESILQESPKIVNTAKAPSKPTVKNTVSKIFCIASSSLRDLIGI